ncbi:MAG: outer membrane receptor protein, partial [Cycloclasticus sp.]
MRAVKKSPLNKYHPLSCFFILLFSQILFADELEELVFFDTDIPVVLSATRLAQPQTEAPASITVIDRALIEASGATEVAELFRLVPGM